MSAAELADARPVPPAMASLPKPRPESATPFARQDVRERPIVADAPLIRRKPWHVRRALVVALVLSLLLHLAWSLWPVDFTPTIAPEEPPLTATLREMPPPPPPQIAPAPVPKTLPATPHEPPRRRPAPHQPVIATPAPSAAPPMPEPAPVAEQAAPGPARAA